MMHANEPDLGPLTWVKSEIDQALARADDALNKAAASAEAVTHIQFAQTHLHQARGALSIVGLDGLTQFATSLDLLLGAMARGERPAEKSNMAVATRAVAAIGNYLEELVRGTPDQALRLFPLYADIARARGLRECSAIDLFHPDLARGPKRKIATSDLSPDEWQKRLRRARARFQRGLLAWLKSPADAAGPRLMQGAAGEVEALQSTSSPAALWWASQAMFEAMAAGELKDSPQLKRTCAQLDKELRQLQQHSRTVPDALVREVLYWNTRSAGSSALQKSVRAAWGLDALIPEKGSRVTDIPLAPLLKSLHAELGTCKRAWDDWSNGQAAALARFETHLNEIGNRAPQLGRPALERLLQGMSRFATWLHKNPKSFNDAIAIEMATALLLAEVALDRGVPEAGFTTQVADTLSRLAALTRGESVPAAELSPTVEAARQQHERQARAQVAREILSNLAHVEQSLDDYFRNQSKRAPLAALEAPLKQIQGALMLIGDERAIALVRDASATIARYAASEVEIDPREFEPLARNLSALGFYITALQHGPADLERFLNPEAHARAQGSEPDEEAEDLGTQPSEVTLATQPSTPSPVAETVATEITDPGAPPFDQAHAPTDAQPSMPTGDAETALPASASASEAEPAPLLADVVAPVDTVEEEPIDAELLEIFLEEAVEVLGNIDNELAAGLPLGIEPLTTIRRGFHTLKGSGRMVGLTDLGEAAWAVEQTLNRWLQLEWEPTVELLEFVRTAHGTFSEWVEQIAGGKGHAKEVATLIAAAEHLREVETADANPAVNDQAPSAESVGERQTEADAVAHQPRGTEEAEPVAVYAQHMHFDDALSGLNPDEPGFNPLETKLEPLESDFDGLETRLEPLDLSTGELPTESAPFSAATESSETTGADERQGADSNSFQSDETLFDPLQASPEDTDAAAQNVTAFNSVETVLDPLSSDILGESQRNQDRKAHEFSLDETVLDPIGSDWMGQTGQSEAESTSEASTMDHDASAGAGLELGGARDTVPPEVLSPADTTATAVPDENEQPATVTEPEAQPSSPDLDDSARRELDAASALAKTVLVDVSRLDDEGFLPEETSLEGATFSTSDEEFLPDTLELDEDLGVEDLWPSDEAAISDVAQPASAPETDQASPPADPGHFTLPAQTKQTSDDDITTGAASRTEHPTFTGSAEEPLPASGLAFQPMAEDEAAAPEASAARASSAETVTEASDAVASAPPEVLGSERPSITSDPIDAASSPQLHTAAEPATEPANIGESELSQEPSVESTEWGDLEEVDLESSWPGVTDTEETPTTAHEESASVDSANDQIADVAVGRQAEDDVSAAESELPPQTPADSETGPIRIGEIELSRTLYELYMGEAREHVATVHEEFEHLQRNPVHIPEETALRAAHTLAGISGTARVFSIHHLARALEHAIGRLIDRDTPPTTEQAELMYRTATTLDAMVSEVGARTLPLAVPELEEQLERVGRDPFAEETDVPAAPYDELQDTSAESALESLEALVDEALSESDELNPAILEEDGTALDETESTAAASTTEAATAPASGTMHAPPATPTTEATTPAKEREPAPVVHDDLDEQLLPIFLEEGADLIAQLHATLRDWQSDPSRDDHAKSTARLLHTLKGSARMAGAMRMGEHVHALESRLEQAQTEGAPTESLLEELVSGMDTAEQMLDVIAHPEKAQPITQAEAGQDDTTTAAGETPASPLPSANEQTQTTAIGAAAGAVAGGATLRVRADLVDGFVNQAGEIGIARTRIEGELRTVRRSLLDLTENVIRLRNQLREVEIQAEVQLQSRIAQAESDQAEFDPLEMDRYTRLQELTRMMAESVGDVTTVQQNLLRNLDGAEVALHSQARMSRELQHALMQVRMVPFDSLADRLHRVVRQSAKDLGKRVNLDLRGGRIELDRSVLEHMTAPLEHLLRNSVAHGIEPTDQRQAAGKDPIGQITLSIAQEGNEISIALKDDGKGLNYEAIAAKARTQGLLEEGEEVDARRLTNLIFVPGFSTATNLSAVSGRGVGMDVVKAETASVGGRIDVSSEQGKGTEFRIFLPLTLAVTQALLVRAGTHSYAIPSSMIAQVMELKADALEKVIADGEVEWQGQNFAYRYLPHLLGDEQTRHEPQRFNWLLLLHAGAQTLALHVDALRGNQEIVVKNAGPQIIRIVGITGATVLGDGEILLILNPVALASRQLATGARQTSSLSAGAAQTTVAPPPEARQPVVMVVDDSLTVRKIASRLLEREGYRVILAKDGSDGLEKLIDNVPDVILSDIEMPRMDGFDFVRNLRSDVRTRDIPVIMITSRLADKHREYAMKIGANHYLGKPYDEDELLGLLRQHTRHLSEPELV